MKNNEKKAGSHIRDDHEAILTEVMDEMSTMQQEGLTSREHLFFKLDSWKNRLKEVQYFVISTEGA